MIPGIMSTEKSLIENVESYFSPERIKNHSFCSNHYLFSMVFRFRRDDHIHDKLINPHPMSTKEEKLVKKIWKSCIDYLKAGLSPGTVYLIPDAEVTFGRTGRTVKPYSRYVLIYKVDNHTVSFIPYSTRVDKINADWDILFDKNRTDARLQINSKPVIDNFPYKMFKKSVVLRVMASQTITHDDFLDIVLSRLGTVNKDVIEFVSQRLCRNNIC